MLFRSLKPYSLRTLNLTPSCVPPRFVLMTMTPLAAVRAVERRARRALHDLDRLDVEAAELVQAADVHDRAVDDDQRLLAAARAR